MTKTTRQFPEIDLRHLHNEQDEAQRRELDLPVRLVSETNTEKDDGQHRRVVVSNRTWRTLYETKNPTRAAHNAALQELAVVHVFEKDDSRAASTPNTHHAAAHRAFAEEVDARRNALGLPSVHAIAEPAPRATSSVNKTKLPTASR